MKNKDKTKGQLLEELKQLRRRISGLEKTADKSKQCLTALKENEWKYRDMLENANDIIQSVAPDGRILYVNRAWRKTLGYSKKDIAGLSLFDIIHPDSRTHCKEAFQRVISGEKVSRVEAVFVTKKGKKIVVEGSANCLFREGKPVATRGIFRDITERKKMEEALLFKSTLLETQVETSIDGILVVDNEGKSIFFNKRFGEMWNIPQKIIDTKDDEKMLEYVLSQLKDPDVFLRQVKYLYSHKGEKSRDDIEFKDGRTFDRYSVPLIDLDAKYYGRIWYFRDISGRRQMEETLRHRLEFEKAISSISSRFISISDIDLVINHSLADIGRLVGVSRAYLFLIRKDGATMDNTHEWCAEGVNPQIDNLQNLSCDTFPWWMKKLRKKEIIYIKDVSRMPSQAKAEKEILEIQNIKSVLVLPVEVNERLIGFVGFDNVVKTGKWNDEDISLLRIFTEILATGLEKKQIENALRKVLSTLEKRIEERTDDLLRTNLKLQQEISERKRTEKELRFREGLEEIIAALSTNFINLVPKKVDAEIKNALKTIGKFLGVDRSCLFLFSADGKLMSNTHEWCAEGIKSQKQKLQGLRSDSFPWVFNRMKRFKILNVPSVSTLPPEASLEKEEWQRQGIKSRIGIPMVCNKQLIGFICLDSVRKKKKWSEEVAMLLKVLGDMFANALVRKKIEAALLESEERYRMLFNSGDDAVFVFGVTKDGQPGKFTEVNDIACKHYGYTREELLNLTPLDIVEPESRQLFSMIMKKILTKKNILAEVITVTRHKKKIPVEINAHLFGFKGRTAILAIARDVTERKRLEKEVMEVGERERLKIGHDLHDELGQNLTGIAFMNRVLEQKLKAKSLDEATQAAKIRQLVNKTITQAGELARGLYPVIEQSDGFMLAAAQLASNVEELFGIKCVFKYNKPVLITDNIVATHLYRIVQESVNNAVKHGKAEHVEISLIELNGRVVLSVKDDGRGFSKKSGQKRGMGLHIMNYRAKMIGATINIHQGADGGTVVICMFPNKNKYHGKEETERK